MGDSVILSSEVSPLGSSHPEQGHENRNIKQGNIKQLSNWKQYQCVLDLLLTERVYEKFQELGRQVRQFLLDSTQATQTVKKIIPNRPLTSNKSVRQSSLVHLQRVLEFFQENYDEMMISVDDALQEQGCTLDQRRMVKTTLTPQRLLKAYQEVQTHHQGSRDNLYPLRRQWIPDGAAVSFELPLHQLMAIHLTNQVTEAREPSIDNAFLNHLEAALLCSPALVRLISDQPILRFRREYGHYDNPNGLFSGGHAWGQTRPLVVTPLAERSPVATLVPENGSSQEKVVVVDPSDVSPPVAISDFGSDPSQEAGVVNDPLDASSVFPFSMS